jgi:nitroreductase
MILSLLQSRRSIRKFKRDRPSREVIESLIEAAVLAPSASNKQPWRFFIADRRELIDEMAAAVQAAVDRIVTHIEPQFIESFRAYGNYFVRFREAPAVIVPAYRELVVLSNLVDAHTAAEDVERIHAMELSSGLISTSLAVQNLMLYAHSIGLGSSSMTGPLLAREELKRLLGVPDSWRLAAIIPVGYPDEEPASVPRKPVDAVIRWV